MEGRAYGVAYRPGTPAPIFANAFESFAEEIGHISPTQTNDPLSDIGQPWEFTFDLSQHDGQSSFDYEAGLSKLDYGSKIKQQAPVGDRQVNPHPEVGNTTLLQDWEFNIESSAPGNQDFLQWIDGAHRPPVTCSYCRYHRLECLIIRTTFANPNPVTACSSCVALFRECSLAIGEKRKASEFETNKPIIGHLHGVNEEYQTGLDFSSWQSLPSVSTPKTLHTASLDVDASSISKAAGFKGRRSLSRQDIRVLKTWLSEHRLTPYPSEEEKLELRATTGLTLLQISNWFANARRRQRQIGSLPIPLRGRGIKSQVSTKEAPDFSPLSRWKNSPPEDDSVDPSVIAQAISKTSGHYQEWADNSESNSKRDHKDFAPFDTRSLSNCDTSQSGVSSDSTNSAWSHSSWASNNSSYTSPTRPRRRRYQKKKKKLGQSNITFSAMYHCTFCPDSFSKRHDWQRHEMSIHLPLEQWICCSGDGTIESSDGTNKQCIFCGSYKPTKSHLNTHEFSSCAERTAYERTFKRKDHLRQHLIKFHGCSKPLNSGIAMWKVKFGELRSRCGFCDVLFSSWEERMIHFAAHFKEGAMIEDWAGDWGFDDAVLAMLQHAELPGKKNTLHHIKDGIDTGKMVSAD